MLKDICFCKFMLPLVVILYWIRLFKNGVGRSVPDTNLDLDYCKTGIIRGSKFSRYRNYSKLAVFNFRGGQNKKKNNKK